MKFHLATTKAINPPSASPVLTNEQVFAGLKIKARDPAKFVPVITTCEVVKEDDTGLTRVVSFKPGTGPPGKITELVTYSGTVKVSEDASLSLPRIGESHDIYALQADFYTPDTGTAVSNIISTGENEADLYLTFTFSWNFAEITEGTEEAAAKAKTLAQMAQQVVPHTIEQIRTLVREGAIA